MLSITIIHYYYYSYWNGYSNIITVMFGVQKYMWNILCMYTDTCPCPRSPLQEYCQAQTDTHIYVHSPWVSVASPVSLQQFVGKLTQQLEQHLNNKNNFCSCHPFPHSGYREVRDVILFRVWGGRRRGVRRAEEDGLWKHKAENVVDTSQPTWSFWCVGVTLWAPSHVICQMKLSSMVPLSIQIQQTAFSRVSRPCGPRWSEFCSSYWLFETDGTEASLSLSVSFF